MSHTITVFMSSDNAQVSTDAAPATTGEVLRRISMQMSEDTARMWVGDPGSMSSPAVPGGAMSEGLFAVVSISGTESAGEGGNIVGSWSMEMWPGSEITLGMPQGVFRTRVAIILGDLGHKMLVDLASGHGPMPEDGSGGQ